MYLQAKREVKNRYGGTDTEGTANYNNENHLVIVSCETSSGCDRYTYGIGFGFSYNQALEKAVKDLKVSNWDFKSSDGYKIIMSEEF